MKFILSVLFFVIVMYKSTIITTFNQPHEFILTPEISLMQCIRPLFSQLLYASIFIVVMFVVEVNIINIHIANITNPRHHTFIARIDFNIFDYSFSNIMYLHFFSDHAL